MKNTTENTPEEKPGLHDRNKHKAKYDFPELVATLPELKEFVRINNFGYESIDFADPDSIKVLNKALLKHFYSIDNWDIPQGYLCPPIPGRADYIHNIADLLAACNNNKIPRSKKVTVLDIGVGANCVYPLIGASEYGWNFVGSEIDPKAIASAQAIISANPKLADKIEIRNQPNSGKIFDGIIRSGEYFDITICNPPFHSSAEEAKAGSIRKVGNLKKIKTANPILNFSGQNSELWCNGGEEKFISTMIDESKRFATSCFWFTTLLSKGSSLKKIEQILKKSEAAEVEIFPMAQGQKISRVVAWTFLTPKQQKIWAEARWK